MSDWGDAWGTPKDNTDCSVNTSVFCGSSKSNNKRFSKRSAASLSLKNVSNASSISPDL